MKGCSARRRSDLYVSISGLGAYFITNRYTLSYVLGVDLDSAERKASRLNASDVVMSFLCDLSAER